MASLARADLESLLRARQLDRTLTSALPEPASTLDPYCLSPTGVAALDTRLGGGLPRGQLSEITGPRSSGRVSLAVRMLASAIARGELVALVDALDMFDPASAEAAGVDLNRLLWIRGHMVTSPGFCRDLNQRALEQAIRALALVLQAGNFGLVVFDAAEAPAVALGRLPFTTWLRLSRLVEGSQTTVVLVGATPTARSAAGVSVKLEGIRDWGLGISGITRSRCDHEQSRCKGATRSRCARFKGNLFEGLDVEARVVRARARVCEGGAVAFSTAMSNHD